MTTLSLQLPPAAASAGISTDDPVYGTGSETPLSLAGIDQNTRELVQAVKRGDADEVRRLIPLSDPKANDSEVLAVAAQRGNVDIVRLLIPVTDPQANNSVALADAARMHHPDIVRLLIPVSDPKANKSAALSRAVATGNLHMVRDLIPVSDPNGNKWLALRLAARKGYPKMVSELVPVSDTVGLFHFEISALLTLESKNMHAPVVNALFPYVGEGERDRAVEQLPPHLIDLMPNLVAWRTARELRACLRKVSAAVPLTPQRRRAL
jgi:hypothetical protein